jgi:septal ring factor EnvC (AmiA/AmiB activator)
MKYVQQYSVHRKKQVGLIREKQNELAEKKTILEQEKDTKSQLLSKEQQEKKKLDTEKTQRNKTISDLQKREKQLRDEIRKNQAEQKRLSQQIERIIQQEVEAARKAAAKRAAEEAAKRGQPTPPPAKPDVTQLTPAEQKLADDFVSNRGKLPWPTERGVITERFGTHDHPVIKGVKVSNDGVTITTSSNESVRAVFNGTVVGVYPSPFGDARTVIIVHGNYRTVYTNLKSVNVKAGQSVTTRQTIGVVSTHDSKDFVGFQLWRDLQKLNPEQWITSR